jgi:hypothetical protein
MAAASLAEMEANSRQLVEEIALQVHFQALEDVNAALAKLPRCSSKRDAQLLYLEQAVSCSPHGLVHLAPQTELYAWLAWMTAFPANTGLSHVDSQNIHTTAPALR